MCDATINIDIDASIKNKATANISIFAVARLNNRID